MDLKTAILALLTGVLYPLLYNRVSTWLTRRDQTPQQQQQATTERISREQAKIRELEIEVEELKGRIQSLWDKHRDEAKESDARESQLETKFGMLRVHFSALVEKSETLMLYLNTGEDVTNLILDMEKTLAKVKEFDALKP